MRYRVERTGFIDGMHHIEGDIIELSPETARYFVRSGLIVPAPVQATVRHRSGGRGRQAKEAKPGRLASDPVESASDSRGDAESAAES